MLAFFNKLFGKSAGAEPSPRQAAGAGRRQAPGNAAGSPLPGGAWLAFRGADREAVLNALAVAEQKPCSWEEGLRGCVGPECRLFVTGPVKDTILVFGSALPDLAYRAKALSWLTELGASIPSVYAFAAQKNVEVYAFVQVEGGALRRYYAAAQGSVRINRGGCSDGEEALGYRLPSNDDELFEPGGLTVPSVEVVRALAAHWSVDPSQAAGTKGVLGTVAKI